MESRVSVQNQDANPGHPDMLSVRLHGQNITPIVEEIAMRGLADPCLKTARAKEHLDDLRERLHTFREDQPITVSREDDAESQKHIIRLKVKDIPEKFALVVGDFLYCVRSSLDQLVFALAQNTIKYFF